VGSSEHFFSTCVCHMWHLRLVLPTYETESICLVQVLRYNILPTLPAFARLRAFSIFISTFSQEPCQDLKTQFGRRKVKLFLFSTCMLKIYADQRSTARLPEVACGSKPGFCCTLNLNITFADRLGVFVVFREVFFRFLNLVLNFSVHVKQVT